MGFLILLAVFLLVATAVGYHLGKVARRTFRQADHNRMANDESFWSNFVEAGGVIGMWIFWAITFVVLLIAVLSFWKMLFPFP
jgi:hypothetical protein